MSGPIDARLWRGSAPTRRYLALTVCCELAITGCTLASAVVLAGTLAGLITHAAPPHHSNISVSLGTLGGLWLLRSVAQWAQARFSDRGATDVIADLDDRLLGALAYAEPRRLQTARDAASLVLTRGLDDLRPYFAGYLPAVLSAAIVTPAAAALIAWSDLRSALIVAVTIPLIPVFMTLIGLLTRDRAASALDASATVSSQILDLIAGIPTLRALGRITTPLKRIAELGAAQRRHTMATLRVAFLSAMALELIATLSVALIAVSIGMRLVFGHMGLATGLTVLILAPEVYWPLRRVGVQFHAAADGKAASDKVFDLLEELPAAVHIEEVVTPDYHAPITLEAVSIADRSGWAPTRLSATIKPGQITIFTGPNGAGKSTALHAIAGLTAPESGRILLGDKDLLRIDRQAWWAGIGWLPQRPTLLAGSVRENLELFGPLRDLESASAEAGFDTILRELPDGLETQLGAGGSGLSLGERQRLCLTRVLATSRSILLLDEPTAHLDTQTESSVLAALVARARAGVTVVLVGHRASVLAVADDIITVEASHAVA